MVLYARGLSLRIPVNPFPRNSGAESLKDFAEKASNQQTIEYKYNKSSHYLQERNNTS